MDRFAPVLLAFPPQGGFADDVQYHTAARSHSQKAEKLLATAGFKDFAPQLLDVRRSLPVQAKAAIADGLVAYPSGRLLHLVLEPAGRGEER